MYNLSVPAAIVATPAFTPGQVNPDRSRGSPATPDWFQHSHKDNL